MSILYPPSIGGVIPSFFGSNIEVPIEHNRLVNLGEGGVNGYVLLVKSINNNVLTTIHIDRSDEKDNVLVFPIPKGEDGNSILVSKNYYKIQVAYKQDDEIGYYSDVAVIRYTLEPVLKVELDNFKAMGTYTNNDFLEKVYEYKFKLYYSEAGKENCLQEDSGWHLHKANIGDKATSSIDTYQFKSSMVYDREYKIEYCIRTINQMEYNKIFEFPNFIYSNNKVEGQLSISSQPDDGIKNIVFNFNYNKLSANELRPVEYILRRRKANEALENEAELYRVKTENLNSNYIIWKDCTFEHGYQYTYIIYASYGERGIAKIVSATTNTSWTFEDMLLSDSSRQLKIRFNPKVSSFKKTIMETKTDTIGGKYPFFFRNGNNGYYEFPISGLISYNMDNAELFMKKEDLIFQESAAAGYMTTDLSDQNLLAERIFKTEVLEWLNNGKPKLFRSPTEGNFIVRLMNVSLTPNDTLGRMLHTFQATAYEIAECTPQNLRDYDIFFEGR